MTIEGFYDENSALIGVKNVVKALYCHLVSLSQFNLKGGLAGTF